MHSESHGSIDFFAAKRFLETKCLLELTESRSRQTPLVLLYSLLSTRKKRLSNLALRVESKRNADARTSWRVLARQPAITAKNLKSKYVPDHVYLFRYYRPLPPIYPQSTAPQTYKYLGKVYQVAGEKKRCLDATLNVRLPRRHLVACAALSLPSTEVQGPRG